MLTGGMTNTMKLQPEGPMILRSLKPIHNILVANSRVI
jgi:hypothetical protein